MASNTALAWAYGAHDALIDAVDRRARTSSLHLQVVVPSADGDFRRVCSCGWFSWGHVSRDLAEADVCEMSVAEAQLRRRCYEVDAVIAELRAVK